MRVFDAYQMRKKIFFLLGLPFALPYLRIYEGIFASRFSAGGDGHKHHLKTFSDSGLTLTPSNVRICRRVLLQTIKNRKFHLPGFTNWGLKFGISEGIKIFSDPWLTFTPPHFRISERNFKKLSKVP